MFYKRTWRQSLKLYLVSLVFIKMNFRTHWTKIGEYRAEKIKAKKSNNPDLFR